MANSTMALPPLPEYSLKPLPPLLPWIEDKYLTLLIPIAGYWIFSLFFHLIDTFDLFPQYRLHTPEELLKRNHATRWDVFRDVILQQIIQTAFGVLIAYYDPDPTYGKEEYDVAVWAQRIRIAQKTIPQVLAFFGVDAIGLSRKAAASYPALSGVLAGGRYPNNIQTILVDGQITHVSEFASWEIYLATFIYWCAIPALQFLAGVIVVDTWQYFMHRGMHMNKWLYGETSVLIIFINLIVDLSIVQFHSRHHRLYVPYAYGALYNHPVEGFFMDTLGTAVAYLVTGMSVRQSMWFFTGSTIKTVDDHCGYALPFDPLQLISTNNAAYHDIHHQSWGIKTNFSQPFFTIWDQILGTKWVGDVSLKYERSRIAAQKAVDRDNTQPQTEKSSNSVDEIKVTTPLSARKASRRKASSISQQTESLKGLRNRVNQNLHGKGGNVLGLESGH
jgi:sphinganine C4-monooxygenase